MTLISIKEGRLTKRS